MEKQKDRNMSPHSARRSAKTPFSSQVASIRINIKWAQTHLSTDQTHGRNSGDGLPFNCYCNEHYLKISVLHLKKHLLSALTTFLQHWILFDFLGLL